MKKKYIIISALLFSLYAVWGQTADPLVLSYKRNFIRASLTTKLDILSDASKVTSADMGPLFEDALIFVIDNKTLLENDAQLTAMAVSGAHNTAKYGTVSAVPLLWQVFDLYEDSRVRTAVLDALSVLGLGDADTVKRLNDFLFAQAELFAGGTIVDTSVVTAATAALGKLADPESFGALFAVITGNMGEAVVSEAVAAFNSISENYTENIISLIENEPVSDKLTALRIALRNDTLSVNQRGEIAEKALAAAINTDEGQKDVSEDLKTLRQEAVREIAACSWTKAAPLVIRYFYMAQTEYKNRTLDVGSVIDIIKCLGVMGTSEAAQTLSIYLGLLNSETEQTGTYNEQIMLAVIKSLGDLGDKTAFDYLLYVGYLNYPETIISASRDALARLKW